MNVLERVVEDIIVEPGAIGRDEFLEMRVPTLRLEALVSQPQRSVFQDRHGVVVDVIDGQPRIVKPSRILVFQDPTLYPWRTVRQNVALGLEARGLLRAQSGRVDDALRQVGLDGFDQAYPHQLSGGMAQRAALARALVNEPSVLLMDEPLANLDSLTRIAMQTELTALWQRERFTGLLVTHDVEEALYLAERVLVLSERPARILTEIAVDLPYPRHRASPRFATLRQQVLEELGLRPNW